MKIVFVLALCAAFAFAQEGSAPRPPVPTPATAPLTQADVAKIPLLLAQQETLNAKYNAILQEMEAMRLRACLAASLKQEQCGAITADGKAVEIKATAR